MKILKLIDPTKPRQLMRPAQFARHAQVCKRTVHNCIEDGKIPFVQIGRIILIDPEKALKAFEHKANDKAAA